MLVQVKKKAQITLPLRVRKAAGVSDGDMLDVSIRDDEIVLRPITKKAKVKYLDASVLKKLEGIFALGGDAVKDSEAIYDK